MKTRLFTICLPAAAIAYLMCMSASVLAAEKKGSESSPPKFSSADETFMMSAAQAGMVEVKLGELAAKNGVTLPSKLDTPHQSKVDEFGKLSGEQFDKAYVTEMVKDHEKVAAEFEKASKTAQNLELKSFAATTLPVIKTHLKHIKNIAAGKSS